MLKYIFKRILLMVPILLVTSFIIFSGMHLAVIMFLRLKPTR